jgi:hypothetical protein
LGDVISHSYRTRCEPDGRSIIQLYGNHVFVENSATEPRTIEFIKEESDPDCLGGVTVNQEATGWSCEGGFLRFCATIRARETAEVRIIYIDKLGRSSYPDNIAYKVKTGLRRYLSETRDQYVSQSAVLSKSAVWVRQLLK